MVDEGGFAPMITLPEIALGLITKAIEGADYANQVKIILDVAATEFYLVKLMRKRGGFYRFKSGFYSSSGLLKYYSELMENYPIIGIEDPFAESDWDAFKNINHRLGKRLW